MFRSHQYLKSLFGALLLAGLSATTNSASASLIGDSVNLALSTQTGQSLGRSSAVVDDSSVEFSSLLGDTVAIDVRAESVVVSFLQDRLYNFRINLSNLDWRDASGALVDGQIVGLEFPGFEPDFSAFFDNSFQLDPVPSNPFFAAGSSFTINLLTTHNAATATEPPGALLLGLGLVGFGLNRYRKSGRKLRRRATTA